MPEKLFDNKLGQVRLEGAVGQNEVRPSDTSRTNDLGYLLSNRPWNKVSGHDIITNAEAKPSASLCERRWSECTTFSTSYLLLWQK